MESPFTEGIKHAEQQYARQYRRCNRHSERWEAKAAKTTNPRRKAHCERIAAYWQDKLCNYASDVGDLEAEERHYYAAFEAGWFV